MSHTRDFYADDFADDLVAALPDWVHWLAELNLTPPALADRCRPYARGQANAEGSDDDMRPNHLARIHE